MISPEQYEEWMHEVEQRPGSASLILRYVFNRLKDLSARNEDLLNDNIALRSEHKVEEYESKISNLEYQLELLRRQFQGDATAFAPSSVETASLFVYDPQGHIVRLALPTGPLPQNISLFPRGTDADLSYLRMLAGFPQEELLFVFDTGRTEKHPADEFSPVGEEGWRHTSLVEPRTGEQLAAILGIARMPLYQACIQISRRGYVKRLLMTSFQQHLQKDYIGSGIKAKPDQTCCLVLVGRGERIALVSREGFILTTKVDDLPYTSEEMLRLSATDYIVTGFVPENQPTFAIVTQTGKLIHREATWLEEAESAKSRGQAIFSVSRRDAGVRIAGAFPVAETEWAAVLHSSGEIRLHRVADLIQLGSIPGIEPPVEVLDIVCFSTQGGAEG